jgi:tetratricopeptide (TPR) repeat protein
MCHDPHQSEPVKDQSAFYRAKCLECHTERPCKLDEAVRLKKENDRCTACHMPRSDTEIPHVAFTRHLIERPGGQSAGGLTGVPELEPVEESGSLGVLERRRNLGLAYLNVNHGGMYPQFVGAFRERARDHLEAVYRAGISDGEVAAALAEIYWELQDPARANLFAQDVIRMPDTTAASRGFANLYVADFQRQSGNLTSAISHLESAIRLRRSADNWRLLGGCYLLKDQLPLALSALKESLAIHPYRPHTHAALAEIYRRQGDQPRAREHLEIAKWLQDHSQN